MKVMVSGANGFLGRRVVDALLTAGHSVRALSRRPHKAASKATTSAAKVEWVQTDLLNRDSVAQAATGVDAVIHLALDLQAAPEVMRHSALEGTRHLIDAMQPGGGPLIMASSFSVYDWRRVSPPLNEDSPLLPAEDATLFGAYAATKLSQEMLARTLCEERRIALTLMRPAMIWGEGQRGIEVVGPRIGSLQVVVSPDRPTQLTHVENCADAFVAALECRSPIRVFNVEDGFAITAADFAQTLIPMGRTLPIPAWATAAALAPIGPVTRWACRRGLPVPGLLIPERVAARFPGIAVDATRLRSELGWTPKYDPREAIRLSRSR